MQYITFRDHDTSKRYAIPKDLIEVMDEPTPTSYVLVRLLGTSTYWRTKPSTIAYTKTLKLKAAKASIHL